MSGPVTTICRQLQPSKVPKRLDRLNNMRCESCQISIRRQCGKWYGGSKIKKAACRSAQRYQVSTATEHTANIIGQGANVCSPGTAYRKGDIGKSKSIDNNGVDGCLPLLALDRLTFSGKFIEWNAVLLDGREHRRDLGNTAGITSEYIQHDLFVEVRPVTGESDFAGDVLGIGSRAEPHHGLILFQRFIEKRDRFGAGS